jgi:hypothetical protein
MEEECVSRCQITSEDQFKPCYASVAFLSEECLKAKILKVEERIWPTITTWCNKCKKPCLITRTLDKFETISAHHVYQLKQLEIMQQSKLFD